MDPVTSSKRGTLAAIVFAVIGGLALVGALVSYIGYGSAADVTGTMTESRPLEPIVSTIGVVLMGTAVFFALRAPRRARDEDLDATLSDQELEALMLEETSRVR